MAKAREVQKATTFLPMVLELDATEVEFLMRLLGENITGGGQWREVSHGIWDAMDEASKAAGGPHACMGNDSPLTPLPTEGRVALILSGE